MPTTQKSKETVINWISVNSELPKNGVKVLVTEDNSEDPVVAVFYYDSGWKLQTLSPRAFTNAINNKQVVVVKFWSYFNMPQ